MAIRALALLLLVLPVVVAGPARASLVTHTLSGVITAAEEPYTHLLGASFTGTMTYETATPAGECLVQWGGSSYHHTPPYDPAVGIDVSVTGGPQFSSSDTEALSLCVFDDSILADDHVHFWQPNNGP